MASVYVRLVPDGLAATITTREIEGHGLYGSVLVDTDQHGRVIGLEILGARAVDVDGQPVL